MLDPTRTHALRRTLIGDIRARFARLRKELSRRIVVVNANPNHDERGRFSTGLGPVLDKAMGESTLEHRAALLEASRSLGQRAKSLISQNVKYASMFDSPKLASVHFGYGQDGPLVYGRWEGEFGGLSLSYIGDKTADVHCHELHHVIDSRPGFGGGHLFSDTDEWGALWRKEILVEAEVPRERWEVVPEKMSRVRVSKLANINTSEGFAEFGRLVHRSGLGIDAVEAMYPGCVAYFRKEKLL